jgi:chromosome segregation ATPase
MSDLPDAPEFGGDVMLPTIDAALRRLSDALGALETVAERRQENDQGQDSLASRIQDLGADRSRLAHELDGSLARSRSLEVANRNIAERLDAAIDQIRNVLTSGESA